jgi:hypothetical protein
MSLPLQQTRELFFRAYLAAYKEIVPVSSFLRSFFNIETTDAKTIALQVQRGSELIAVDIQRGTDGTRNTFDLFTEKEYLPPFYNENFDATSLDRYDRGFNQPDSPPSVIGLLAGDVAQKLNMLRDKIERRKELQCSQVFETGIVTMVNGDNIDFKRKAGSMVDLTGAGGYWSTITTDVEAQLIAGAEFIRNNGKNGSPIFNLTMSGSEWLALKKTNYFTAIANFQNVLLLDVTMPQKNAFGAGLMGRISAGAYQFNVWTYDEVYETGPSKTITRYWPANKVVMTPEMGTRFTLAHAGVPAIMRDVRNAEFPEFIQQQSAEYWINNYIDPKGKSHTFEILSAAVAIPVTVDMIYTMQALA